MGMPGLARRYWTAEDVRALMDESRHWPRYELLDGELLVTPAPNKPHQLAVTAMVALLAPYCDREALGVALVSPADIELVPESIMQPDVFVVPEAIIGKSASSGWQDVTSLLLAVEVLSPSTQRQDRVRKRDFYLANGVREYWILDLDARIVEGWRPNSERPSIHRDEITWHPAGAASPLRIDLKAFFERDCRLPQIL